MSTQPPSYKAARVSLAATAGRVTVVGLVLTAGSLAALQAEPDPAVSKLAQVRESQGFAAWPGKGGGLRPAVNAARVLSPLGKRVRLLWVHGPAAKPGEGLPLGTVELMWSSKSQPKIAVKIWAAPSCDDAHEVLVRRLAAGNAPPGMLARGKHVGISLGDVSFVAPGSTKFVRSNVVVYVYDEGKNAIQIAQAIDRALCAKPARKSLDALRPRIQRLALAPDVGEPLNAEKTPTVPLVVDAVDPSGGELFMHWDRQGAVHSPREAEPGKFVFTPATWAWQTKKTGVEEGRVILTAISTETGLYSTGELRVNVAVRKRPSPPPDAEN